MSVFDPTVGGYRIFIGDLGPKVSKIDFQAEMELHGHVISTWIARSPPVFAFVVFRYAREAERAVNRLHGSILCGRAVRVQHARSFEERVERLNHKPRTSSRHRPRSSSSRARSESGLRSRHECSHSFENGRHGENRSRSRSQRSDPPVHHKTRCISNPGKRNSSHLDSSLEKNSISHKRMVTPKFRRDSRKVVMNFDV